MAFASLDPDLKTHVVDIVKARLGRIPRRGGQLQHSWPYPTYVVFTPSLTPEHVGWEVIAFDGDEPMAMVEIAEREGELRWVNSASGSLPRALAAAMHEAEQVDPDGTMDFGLIKAPQAGLFLLWLDNGLFIPLRTPHLRNQLPDGPLDEAGLRQVIERILRTDVGV